MLEDGRLLNKRDFCAGAGNEPAEGEEITEDAPQMPRAPNYEGLGFSAARELPEAIPDIKFPPCEIPQPPVLSV